MTMNKIREHLREHDKGRYRILEICIFLSMLLLSSFTMMYFSKTVQEFLPEGGDTRKMFLLMLGVTAAGCVIFTLYGFRLFLRYKSREFGVFLALGEKKGRLAQSLIKELSVLVLRDICFGIAAGIPVSALIWKLFGFLVPGTDDLQYRFSFLGVVPALLLAAFLMLCIFLTGRRFLKKADLMDILKEEKKTELEKELPSWTGKAGLLLTVAGLVLALGVPQLSVSLFRKRMPSLWNLTWLLCLAGLYLFLESAVAKSGKGRNPEKYYKNNVSSSLMRYTARQTTKNMCVITLLVAVTLLSVFWSFQYYSAAVTGSDSSSMDFVLHYPEEENQLTKEEIVSLAGEHDTDIPFYE